jgi:IS1 family transposase
MLAQNLNVTAVQADERWGFAQTKQHQLWESVTLDPSSKFVIGLHLGSRTETVIRALLEDTVQRVLNPQGIVLFTDGLSSYAQVFPEVFGIPFQTSKSTHLGRPRAIQYRIPRALAHVQVIKNREGRKLKTVEVRVAHGSQKRVNLELERLGYNIANTSAIERQNGSARESTMFMGRKGLSFARLDRSRVYAAEISRLGYNWVRLHRSLRVALVESEGRKKFEGRTPAMKIGIAARVWSWAELVVTPVWAMKAVRNHSH